MTYVEILNKIEEKTKAAGVLLDSDAPNVEEANKLLAEVKSLRELAETTKKVDDAKAAVTSELAELRKEPPTNPGFQEVEIIKDEADKALEAGPAYKSLGEFLLDVYHFQDKLSMPQAKTLRSLANDDGFNVGKAIGFGKVGSLYESKKSIDHQVRRMKAISGLSELIPTDGGLLVGTDQDDTIISRMYGTGQLLQMINIIPISSTSNSLTINGENETSRKDGSRRGGIQAYWEVEGGEKTSSKPTFRKIRLDLNKIIGLVYATDEVLADAPALEAWIMQHLPEELRFKAEDGIVRGTGTGMPQGIISATGRVTVAKEAGQAADTVVSENIIKMWARRWVRATDYIWMVNQDVTPQLHQMNLPVGTGGALVYMPPGGLSVSPYGTLYGRPVMEFEYCSTVGTEGDIILFSPSQYQGADKGGIQSAVSMHVRFIYDEQVFRFVYRFDAQPLFGSPLTPYQGTNTVSGYVTLADRD